MTLQTVLAEGRLIRHVWSRVEEGRQLLCLYTALVDDPEARPGDGMCPASTCPQWLAHLLPWINDAGTEAAWRGHVERVAAIADRLGDLTPECEYRIRALCVREAMRHTSDTAVLAVCERVAALCESRGRGDEVASAEWAAARAAEAAEADRLIAAILDELEHDLARAA